MTERLKTINRIAERLSSYVTYIRLMTKDNYNDGAVDAENSFMQLLNLVYGWNLVNANAEDQNAAGIDLIDRTRKLIVQVSTQAKSDKIKDTLEQIQKKSPLYDSFTLKYLFIVESYKPQAEVEVIDLTCLIRGINALSDEKVKEVDALVSQFFALSIFDNNEDYKRKIAELKELEERIGELYSQIQQYPELPYFKDEHQKCLNTYNAQKEELEQDRQAIFNLVQRIASIQGQVISDRMKRAIDAFNKGDVSKARIILDEAEHDNVNHADLYLKTEAAAKAHLKNAITAIEEQSFKTSVIMADVDVPISSRIAETFQLWQEIDSDVQKIDYAGHEPEKCMKLLNDYFDFLEQYGKYKEALTIQTRLLSLRLSHYGEEHEDTAASYNNLGLLNIHLGHYLEAIAYLEKSVSIKEKVLGTDHPDTATSYNNIGGVYHSMVENPKALEYYEKASSILEKVLGIDHPDTATSYNNIGSVYMSMGDYSKALEYYEKALGIREKVLGSEHPDTATSYNNIGLVYHSMGEYPKALEYYEKALGIEEKVLGTDHPDTAISYNNIGAVYWKKGDYPKALVYYEKALGIREMYLGTNHLDTATSYHNIGTLYYKMGKYSKAMEYLEKALAICERVLGAEHPNTKTTKVWIQIVQSKMNDE